MIQNAEGAGLLSARPTRRKRAPEAAHMAFFWFLASKDDYSVYLESRISILHERSNDFLLNKYYESCLTTLFTATWHTTSLGFG